MRSDSNLATRCQAWLELEAENARMTERWSDLETLAVREFGWFNLSPAERRSLPMTAEMDKIQARLEGMDEALRESLQDLHDELATELGGAVGKLMVAARLFHHEPDDEHQFLVSAVAELVALTRGQ